MIITSDVRQIEMNAITTKALQAATYGFSQPFYLDLTDNQAFYAEEIIRLVPKKRLVAFGTWQGKSAVIKIFLDASNSKRHVASELLGVNTLQDHKVPTPTLFYQGSTQDKKLQILIFERIHHATNFYDIGQQKSSFEEMLPAIKQVIVELATQHVLGIMQKDLHLKNFLVGKKVVYSLDGSQIEKHPFILPKKQSMKHFALFLSQLSAISETHQETLFRYYAKQRGWLLKEEDFYELTYLVKQWNEERSRRFQKKIFRDSTQYASFANRGKHGMYDREYAGEDLLKFLQDPESAFNQPQVTLLKSGRSATVIKTVFDGHPVVIKRYNLKNKWHRLRRLLRKTRAFESWRLAQKLNLFGVNTAKPIAFIENKFLCFHGVSYFVSEYVSALHAGQYFSKPHTTENGVVMVERIAELFGKLRQIEMTHGDLKITNILIDQQARPVLIDLDGAREHTTLTSLRRVWSHEIARFLKNFQQEPVLLAKFSSALNK